jgi:hypothetical protein
VAIFARDAAVPAVARLEPPVIVAVAAVNDAGLARVEIREGRALAFSVSLNVAVRVVRVTRRVYETKYELTQ